MSDHLSHCADITLLLILISESLYHVYCPLALLIGQLSSPLPVQSHSDEHFITTFSSLFLDFRLYRNLFDPHA